MTDAANRKQAPAGGGQGKSGKRRNVAVVGATGAVGRCLFEVLAERDFPLGELHALASGRSAGKRARCGEREIVIEDLAQFDFRGVDIALFSAGGAVSAEHAPRAVAAGCVVVDNTSQFRYDDAVPLVVPEVNPGALAAHQGIVANPNCSTIQMVVALAPLRAEFGLRRVNVATYQAVSGAGLEAIDEMQEQSRRVLAGEAAEPGVFPRQIAFNALPHIDAFMDNGYTKEEMKMVWETQKIFDDQNIRVNPTAVRVPVVTGHSEAVHIECEREPDVARARAALAAAPGVVVVDERAPGGYPTAAVEAAGNDAVFVGRIRKDISSSRGLALWVVSDNLRKGAATNSVQIAEALIAGGLA